MNRRRWSWAVLVVAAAALALLCLHYSKSPSQEQITLKVIGEDYSPMQGLEKIKDRFTAETGLRVEISRFDAETLRKKSIGDFQAGAANYDVIMGAFYDVGLFAANGWVLDVGEALSRDGWRDPKLDMKNFSEPILNLSCRYKDKLWALPCSAQCMFLWYRTDLFGDPGEQAAFRARYGYDLPQPTPQRSMTWAQYRDVAEFFTRKAGEKAAGKTLDQDLYGTLLQGKNHVAIWFEFNNFLHSFGGTFIAPDGAVVADSPQAREALTYYVGLKPFAPPGTVNYNWDEALSTFQSGQVAMVINWSDAITAVVDPKQSQVFDHTGFAAVPTLREGGETASVFGGWGLFVNAKSRHPREAVQLIQWANRPDVQIAWAQAGGIPATLSTYKSPEYAKLPGSAAHLAALGHLVGWSNAPYSAQMISIGQDLLARAMAGEITPEQALTQLAQRLRGIVGSAQGT